ncbi:MAG: NAD(P)-binding protein [Candidatus Aminicenantes bacterium]|nr:NAD(P)-binding protein [Candidatus Aminicenantes bacterium]
MGFKILELKLPTGFDRQELEQRIKKKLKTVEFSYTIEKQSLDARKKENIHWLIRVGVSSPALRGPGRKPQPGLEIPFKKRDKKVLLVGSGPAGFFCAYVLVLAGFKVTIIEQGSRAAARLNRVSTFERTGQLDENDNYAFGEGGAGTFSDGKLTSRTKSISKERNFIFQSYIEAGAPEEIAYLAHPHLGSDNLVKIVANLGREYLRRGGVFLFNTKVRDIYLKNGIVEAVETGSGKIEADYFVFAAGHSAYETYRLLMGKGVPFRVKPFAIGCRVEHPQELVNLGQWGCSALPGVKAAEYRLTFKDNAYMPVYSFCMCPGGKVVPAAPYKGLNIVNGKSNYARNLPFANAAIVAGINLNHLLKKEVDPLNALEWLEKLEKNFFALPGSYAAPACKIEDFLGGRISASLSGSSYPFPLFPADFRDLFPEPVCTSLRAGMQHFCKKMKGFEKGIMLGLESKTSAPVQALREKGGRSAGVKNLYICGEGGGWAGGIVSSAADGIKTALTIAQP